MCLSGQLRRKPEHNDSCSARKTSPSMTIWASSRLSCCGQEARWRTMASRLAVHRTESFGTAWSEAYATCGEVDEERQLDLGLGFCCTFGIHVHPGLPECSLFGNQTKPYSSLFLSVLKTMSSLFILTNTSAPQRPRCRARLY